MNFTVTMHVFITVMLMWPHARFVSNKLIIHPSLKKIVSICRPIYFSVLNTVVNQMTSPPPPKKKYMMGKILVLQYPALYTYTVNILKGHQ